MYCCMSSMCYFVIWSALWVKSPLQSLKSFKARTVYLRSVQEAGRVGGALHIPFTGEFCSASCCLRSENGAIGEMLKEAKTKPGSIHYRGTGPVLT